MVSVCPVSVYWRVEDLLGVTRRYQQIRVAAICTRARPLGDSIAFDGLSEAVLFQGSETGMVLPKTVTHSASHSPYFSGPTIVCQ